jgi:hypothetical protein
MLRVMVVGATHPSFIIEADHEATHFQWYGRRDVWDLRQKVPH